MPSKNPLKKSSRPKARPSKGMRPGDEGSTRHPSGKNIHEQHGPIDTDGTRHPSGKNIHEQDTKHFMNGGMAEMDYKDGGTVRRGDVRDNAKRGKCY